MVTQSPSIDSNSSPPPSSSLLQKARKGLKKTVKVTQTFSSICNVVEIFAKVSAAFSGIARAMDIPDILQCPFFIKKCIDNVVGMCTKTAIHERVRAAFTFVVNANYGTASIASACALLKTVKLVGEQAVQWIPIFNIVSFIASFISVGLAAESVHRSRKLFQQLNTAEKNLREATDDVKRAAILVELLREVEERGLTEVRKKLLISKKTNIEKRITELIPKLLTSSGLEQKKALTEGSELVGKLKNRAKTTLIYDVLSLANKVLLSVASILLFIPPAVPIGIILIATNAVMSLVLFGGKSYFVRKDPFSENASCKAYALYEKISNALKNLRLRLETFIIAKRRFQKA